MSNIWSLKSQKPTKTPLPLKKILWRHSWYSWSPLCGSGLLKLLYSYHLCPGDSKKEVYVMFQVGKVYQNIKYWTLWWYIWTESFYTLLELNLKYFLFFYPQGSIEDIEWWGNFYKHTNSIFDWGNYHFKQFWLSKYHHNIICLCLTTYTRICRRPVIM